MSGFTKHMSQKFLEESKRDFSNYIKKLITILPVEYDLKILISLLEKYYPYELKLLHERYDYYRIKDKKLGSLKNKKPRHSIPEPKIIIEQLGITKKIMEESFRKNHKLSFDEVFWKNNILALEKDRLPKIKKIEDKIEKATSKAQNVEPIFLDELMGLYDRKTTSQKDKVYIIKELEKYYCSKVITFFRKKVDTELNRQLREMAFYHLQELKHHVVLRRQKYMRIHSKNKKRKHFLKKEYPYEKFNIQAIPEELEYRIENSKEQKLKEYDFFISHSSSDFKEVQNLIKYLNSNGKNIYCDWINDTDYLKRHLVGEATKSIIEKRLQQSKNILFVKSDSSLKSDWVKYELNYFNELNKPIFEISKDFLITQVNNIKYEKMEEFWFLDKDYKEINLFYSKET